MLDDSRCRGHGHSQGNLGTRLQGSMEWGRGEHPGDAPTSETPATREKTSGTLYLLIFLIPYCCQNQMFDSRCVSCGYGDPLHCFKGIFHAKTDTHLAISMSFLQHRLCNLGLESVHLSTPCITQEHILEITSGYESCIYCAVHAICPAEERADG